MSLFIGLDIGGTKIAGGVFTPEGAMLAEKIIPVPRDYPAFITSCANLVASLESLAQTTCTVGVGVAGGIDSAAGSVYASGLPFMRNLPFRHDLESSFQREVRLANDANCMALAEAVDGAGKDFTTVLGLIVGTGVGAGIVHRQQILVGPNGLAGEIGHLPLPFREPEDGPFAPCSCRQQGCIDATISGPGLSRLYALMTGREASPKAIAEMAEKGDSDACRVLDRYFETVAKAMVVAIHSFDPDVIVVSGGLCALPGLYDEVPRRWGKYALAKKPKTKFVPAKHGPMSGVRGAAWLWR
ncbi:MAG: ROK family protein [Alphaproteobacteria bacterium]|nr:ROK family protein [Alphaproteobacteria bacterium]